MIPRVGVTCESGGIVNSVFSPVEWWVYVNSYDLNLDKKYTLCPIYKYISSALFDSSLLSASVILKVHKNENFFWLRF
jgi:hypothetical protein